MLELALFGQLLVWLVVLAIFLSSSQASLFHPATVYIVFHGLVFVLRPWLVYTFNFDSVWKYIGFVPTDAQFVQTLLVTSVALVVFVFVSFWVGRMPVGFSSRPAFSFSDGERIGLLAATLILMPLLAYSIYITNTGQSSGAHAANGVFIMTNSTGYINDAQYILAPLLCAWLLLTRFHLLNLIPIVVYLGYRTWCGWSRFTIITFLLTVVLTYCWYHRKKWVPKWTIAVALPTLILFNVLGHNRDLLQSYIKGQPAAALEFSAGMTSMEKMRLAADTQDFANFDYLAYLLSIMPDRTGTYTYGTQHLQLLTEPIPRILWSEKPIGSPINYFNIMDYGNFMGLTMSMPGDGWFSGGWIGLVITMAVGAALAGAFHRWFWHHSDSPIAALFYASAVAMLIQWYRDGGYVSMAKFMFWDWLPLILWVSINWLLSPKPVPIYSAVLSTGTRIRLLLPK